MPSTYSGDRTATQSPSSPPAAGVAPELVIPVDGDAVTASSVNQELKTLADYIAYERQPFGNPSQWGQRLKSWQNARLQNRFAIDHNGLPAGKFIRWTEDWSPGSLNQGASGGFGQAGVFSVQNGRWKLISNAASGATSSQPPGVLVGPPSWSISNTSRCLNVKVDGSGPSGNFTEVYTAIDATSSVFTDDAQISVDFDFQLTAILSMNWAIGIVNQGEDVNAIAHGIFLFKADGTLNFHCRTINGGSPTDVDSLVSGAAGVDHHLRIEFIGANVSDDTVAHAIFYLDDNPTPVANITTTLPQTGGPYPAGIIFGGVTTGGIANALMLMGPVSYGQITAI